MAERPAAFMSYVRFNDRHDDGQISQFRERLAAEVRAQTGIEFPIFQDRSDIAWGQNWQERIDGALDAATLLLVIVTPSLFGSAPCRAEFHRFRERERALGRSDLILPIYWIGTREIDDPAAREADEMARVLASRQHADWRELRFEPITGPAARRAIAALAGRMRDVSWQTAPTPNGAEPPDHIVDPYGRGHFTTITAAIDSAQPGDRILVRPGLYEEGLVIDKPLEIIGDGLAADVVVRAQDADVLLFEANIGRVTNMTLQQAGGGGWYGVDIAQGRLALDSCDISSESLACVGIHDGADPRLRHNRIHDGKQSGVLIYDDGRGTVEDNDIGGHTLAGVAIRSGGKPVVRRNRIHDNEENGIVVSDDGRGTLEDNDIVDNGYAGIHVMSTGRPVVRRNRINRNVYEAIWVGKEGRGVFEDNDLTDNERGPWDIEDTAGPVKQSRNKED